MDFDLIQKQIQGWTNSIPLLILGSGASVPYGIPSMYTLGEHLKNSIAFSEKEDQEQFDAFKSEFNKNGDLESTLLGMNLRPNVLNAIVCKTWELINSQDVLAYEQILQKSIDLPLSTLINYLLSTSKKKVSIVTTNYDRIAEYASSVVNAFICNGFTQNFHGLFSNSIHKNDFSKLKGYAGQVNIWKVHGSLDWFKSIGEEYLHFPLRQNIPANFIPSIVTPGLAKYLYSHLEPYRTIFTEADSEIEQASSYLCIGYGFNDAHVHPKLISQIRNGKPIIIITKELTNGTKKAIIDGDCKQYILMEQINSCDTRIYSSLFAGEKIVSNASYWTLNEYLKLII